MPVSRIFLIRHANASEGPRDGERGRHLTDLGRRQADALARRLAHWHVDRIHCSDKHRSHETAAAVHAFHPGIPLIADKTFREVSRRDLEGFESGDSEQDDLPERLETAWNGIISLSRGVSVVIAHNGLIKFILGRVIKCEGVLKPRFHCTETGITGIQMRPRPLLDFFNDTHHLSEDLVTPGTKLPWIEALADTRAGLL